MWICWVSGSPEESKWVSFGDLEGANLIKVTILETRRFQGGSQTPKRSHLASLWRHFGVSFRRILRCVFYDCFKQNVMSLFKLLATSGRIFVKAHLVNARVVKHFVYNAPALNVPPVPSLRQVCQNALVDDGGTFRLCF